MAIGRRDGTLFYVCHRCVVCVEEPSYLDCPQCKQPWDNGRHEIEHGICHVYENLIDDAKEAALAKGHQF